MNEALENILFEEKGGVAIVTLNRPKALNALTFEMIKTLDEKLYQWEEDTKILAVLVKSADHRAFCSGGDVKAVAIEAKAMQDGRSDGQITADFFRAEYRLNHHIFNFEKPYISFVNGIVMGGGVGVSAHGSFRVVTEKTLFAMPETSIGYFPDVGGSSFLNKCPGNIGLYLALTSQHIKAEETLYSGFGTHYIPSIGLEDLEHNLLTADWKRSDAHSVANAILANYSGDLDGRSSNLAERRPEIDLHFSQPSVEEIFKSLQQDQGAWAQDTLKQLNRMSPTSLKLAFKQLTQSNSENMDFEEAMIIEYRISQGCMKHPDFYEGIRAALIDKDRKPKWNPKNIEDVNNNEIDLYFESLEEKDLSF